MDHDPPCYACLFCSTPEDGARRCQNVFSDHYARPIEAVQTCAEFVAASGQTEALTQHEA